MKITERKENIKLLGGLENLSILHISDIHLWYATGILKKLAAAIYKYDPDIILLTGDYYDLPIGAHHFRQFLLQISQNYLMLFIRGNHDKLYGSKVSNRLMGIPNCVCVEDRVFQYESKRGYRYNITEWANRKALPAGTKEVNIILIHNPERIRSNELVNIDLILAGHLHGGQFVFYKTKDTAHFPGNMLYRHCTDRKQINETTLIVSRGLGDTFPFRLNCPKEIIHISIE